MVGLGGLARKIFGSANDRRIRSYRPAVQAVGALDDRPQRRRQFLEAVDEDQKRRGGDRRRRAFHRQRRIGLHPLAHRVLGGLAEDRLLAFLAEHEGDELLGFPGVLAGLEHCGAGDEQGQHPGMSAHLMYWVLGLPVPKKLPSSDIRELNG